MSLAHTPGLQHGPGLRPPSPKTSRYVPATHMIHTLETKARVWDIDGEFGRGDSLLNDDQLRKTLADMVSYTILDAVERVSFKELTRRVTAVTKCTLRGHSGEAPPLRSRVKTAQQNHLLRSPSSYSCTYPAQLRTHCLPTKNVWTSSTVLGDPSCNKNSMKICPDTLQSVMDIAGINAKRCDKFFKTTLPIGCTYLHYDADGEVPTSMSLVLLL